MSVADVGATVGAQPLTPGQQAYELVHLIDRRVVRRVQPFARTLVRVINSIPQNIYTGTMAATNAVAAKLEEFGDALSGKNTGGEGGEHGFVQVKKEHFDYMQRLRKEDRKQYERVVNLSRTYKAAPPSNQDSMLLAFFALSSGVMQEATVA